MSAQGGDAAAAQQNDPALAQLQAELLQLRTQITTLQASNTNMGTQLNALQANPTAAQAATTHAAAAQAVAIPFALTPATSNLTGLIDFASKLGTMVYKEGCKKLSDDEGFSMTPATTSAFVKAFNNRCNIMGWNQGTQGITSHANATGVIIDIVKAYGQIDETTLKTRCDDFCKAGGANFQNRAAQNNHMMAQCLTNSLTPAAQARLEPYQAQFTFDGIEYGPLKYKIIMRLATIDSVATTETLRKNLDNLPIYAASVNGDVDMINSYFDATYSQIIARGATVDDPLAKLFDGYLAVPDATFNKYIKGKQERYHDDELGATYTYENLMAQASAKFSFLKTREVWGAKSPEEERLVALIAELKGKLKLAPELEKKKKEGGKKGKGGGENSKKVKNKKNTSNKKNQKQEEQWMKTPPKDGDPKEKTHKGKAYHWCEHHMAWGMHSPKDCRLGASRKDGGSKKEDKPNSVVAAAAAATVACPSIASIISNFTFDDKE